MTVLPKWLAGKVALVVGEGPAVDAVAAALAQAGAVVKLGDGAAVEAPQIAQAFDAAGQVDLLVHGGTLLPGGSAEDIGLERWRNSFSADLDGRYLHAAEFTRRRLTADAPGNILFLMPAFKLEAGRALAITAHGALDNLVKSLAVEWARDGIRVNAIASRTVDDFAARTPAEQQSLGYLAAYLLSGHAAYVTGTVAGIDEV